MVAVRVDLAVGEKLVRQALADRGASAWRSRKWRESPVGIWGKGVPGGGLGKLKAEELHL